MLIRLKIISDNVIFNCIMKLELIDDIILPLLKVFPCYPRTIELSVKIITKAYAAVCWYIRKNVFIKNSNQSRVKNTVFDNRTYYNLQ